MIELVSAYVPFANGGVAVAPHVIEKVRTAGGKVIYKAYNPGLGRVIDERHAAMMNQMMQETLTSGTARTAALGGFPAAGKTGTSQDYRDAWFIGYTGHLVAGVWLGNDDNTSTKKLTGGALPAEIWNHFMVAAHQGLPMADLPGMAGRTIEPAQPAPGPAQVAPQAQSPLISMLAPPASVPLGRDDDMRVPPLTPLAPARPPAVAAAPLPHAQPRPAAPAPRPPQSVARVPVQPPPRNIQLAPQSPYLVPPAARTAQAPHTQVAHGPTARGDAPRPPGGIGGYSPPPQAQPQRTADNSSGIGDFFGNLFGRR